MALNFMAPERKELTPRITVFGVGGAGGNAVNNMIDKNLEGVEFVVANTDAQALAQSRAPHRIQLGVKVTEGLGAGARPTVGAAAAEETLEEIIDHLSGAHMCFITAGMGGGTGTGAAPIIAQAAREMGVLTVGVVTKPFSFEGAKRMRQAEEGVEALQKVVDTLIIIPNQNLFRLANERTTFSEAFALADDVLYQGVKGVTDLMVRPGMINLDFADVRAVMDEMGKAMMGTGDAAGEDRARVAAEMAIANPLLDEISLHGAKGVLINITGGMDLTLFELDEAANLIREKVDQDANIIVGSTLDPSMEGKIRVSVVATGIESTADAAALEVQRRRLAEPLVSPHTAAAPAPQPVQAAPVAPVAEVHEAPAWEPAPREMAREMARERLRATSPAPAPAQDAFDLDEVFEQPAPVSRHPAQEYAPPRAVAQAPMAPEPAWHPEDDWHTEAARAEPQQQPRYEPRPAAHQTRSAQVTPSPATMDRLRAAVEHRAAAQPQPQPVQAAPQPAAEGRSRFPGIGNLLNRMTGHAEAPAAPRAQPRMPQSAAPAPSYDHHPEPAPRGAEERIEIPAFLRRQAN